MFQPLLSRGGPADRPSTPSGGMRRRRARGLTARRFLLVTAVFVGSAALTDAAVAQPTFTKQFLPDTIGSGSITRLRLSITNGTGAGITDLDFTDNLPAAVSVATPAAASTTCGGTLTAPDGSASVSFTGGVVSAFSTCTVEVDVVSSTIGIHTNTTGDLTSSAGNSGAATDDLEVEVDRPSFTKSFSPSSVSFGGRSTLTFLIDNSANAGIASGASFTDNLPPGMVIASPSNGSTDCLGANLTAAAGTSTITMFGGALLAASTCTVTVDVTATTVGTLVNRSGELTSSPGGAAVSSGFATDALLVTGSSLLLSKEFTTDPVNPGGVTTLEFTLTNVDRNFDATSIAFTDDLDATLSGLAATGSLPVSPCGPGSTLGGTSILTLSGGSLAADGGSCTFSVELQVPAGAVSGSYPNITSSVTADIGGAFIGSPASDTLFVTDAPALTKTFLTDPIGAGDTVTLEFTVTNSSTTSAATDVTFSDNLSQFISGATPTGLPATGSCGAGSLLFSSLVIGETVLNLTGGNLPPGGSCTFSVDLLIPVGTPPGTYDNLTSTISATVNATTQVGNSATDSLTVVGAPSLTKEFTDDPVAPGSTVTLEFSLSHDAGAPADATAIAFTDDLDAALTGLTAIGLPLTDVCGVGSQISGTTSLSFTGGVLSPGATCTFSVTLQVPAGALPGVFTNVTSNLAATVSGIAVSGNGAQDQLQVTGLTLTKEFTDDPVIPGGTSTLEFTIVNSSTQDATGMFFTDNLTAALSGLAATGSLPVNPCGTGSSISGTTFLIFTGGNLTAGAACTFAVDVQVPGAAANGSYLNVTSNLTATVGGSGAVLPPAADSLVVDSMRLELTKEFTDDPVAPGGTATLEFTVTNLDLAQAATGVSFTDDLDAALSGLMATGLPLAACGGNVSGTGLLTLTGGSVAAGASCTFSVQVMVPSGVPIGTTATNVTSSVAGSIGGLPVTGDPASDTLTINFLDFTKSFSGLGAAGSTPSLTFTITNVDATNAVSGLQFQDDLDAVVAGLVATGLPMSDVCGTGSVLSGTSVVTLSSGELSASGSCTFTVDLQVPAGATPGSFLNTTSDLLLSGLSAAAPATATLVIEPPPGFSKSFAPTTVSSTGISTLTLTLDHSAAATAATALDFTDNLPAGLVVASPSNASTTCTGGTLTAVSGSAVVSYIGGTVAGGATCTVSLDVTAATAGSYVNVTGSLTSSHGDSGTATSTLTVDPPPTLMKTFVPASLAPGNTLATVVLTIDNTASSLAVGGLDVTDSLPSGMTVAATPNASSTCTGGTLTATASSGSFQYSGGTVAGGATCTVQVDVEVAAAGTYVNTTGSLNSDAGSSGPASATLVADPPSLLTSAFTPAILSPGSTASTLVLTIDNTMGTATATGLGVTGFLPSGMVVATTPNAATTCTGGTLTANAGDSSFAYAGGSVAAGASCTVQADVVINAAGTFVSTTSVLTSGSGSSPPASATLIADPAPLLQKSFAPSALPFGQTVTTVVLTIDNSLGAGVVGGLDVTDNLPAGMVVASPANEATTCTGGTLTALPGDIQFQYSGGSVAAGGTCTVQVDVEIGAPGTYINTTTSLLAAASSSAGASATLTVSATPATVIPTLSDVVLAVFAGLLALLAVGVMRRS